MEYWNCPSRRLLLILPAAYLLILLLFSVDSSASSTAMIEIEQDSVWVDVSPGSYGTESMDATVRSSSARNVILDVHYELDAPSTWSVDGPDQLFMEPFGKKAFKVDIFVPMGELAERIGELTITATVQGEETLDIGSDSVQINIQEFRQMTPVIGSDYILDLPAEGEIELELRNDGNVDTRFILFDMENIEGVPDTGNGLDLHPGETGTFTFEYSLSGDLTIQQLSSIFGDGSINENILDLRFLKDGELFHLLFRPGPFLILTPDLDAGPLSVNIFSLGGKLENIGLEIVDGPEDAYIEIDERPDLSDLERRSLEFKVGGFTGNEILTIRAYGFDGDTRSGSNPILVSVQGDRAEGGPLISTSAAVAGGSMAAAVTLTAGAAVYLYSASEVFRYRWLLLALVPLYSITRGAKVLDHFFRGRLFEYIKENPGATFTALKEHFEVNNGTLTYHLHKLEREELITYRNLGKYKLFYADGMRIKGCEVVISPLDRDIIKMISENPGMTTKQVITSLRGARSQRTLSRHLKQLERKGFLVVERSHGARRLFISDEMERVLMPHLGVIEVADVIGSG